MKLPEKISNLVDRFSKIPGIGEKTALRYALMLTNWDADELYSFGNSVKEISRLKRCSACGMYADEDICEICTDHTRKSSTTLCVVETVNDCLAIERSEQFKGRYHVLGGVLNPLLGVGPDELRMDFFIDRIKKENVEEIILAVNPSVEGDATCAYIRDLLPETVRINRIGFGIPIGGNLEYLDSMTISKALENRQKL